MYKKFSDYYDLLTFDIDYDRYARNIVDILDANNIKQGQILEIACGTGNLTEKLAKYDFTITAFDNSMEMLNIAFPKLIDFDNVNLIYQDMYEFDYRSYEFDAIVCLLDVVNYILDEESLREFFTGVYEGLKPGGIFAFDINSEYKLKTVLADNSFIYEKDNIFYTWENAMDGDLVDFYLNFFVEEDGFYTRVEERQTERYYSIDFIKGLLESIGFTDITFIDEDTGLEVKDQISQRILFKAKK